jgi:hypothetical protein
MLKFIDGLPKDVLAIEATGKVTHEDYKSTLIPVLVHLGISGLQRLPGG